MFASRIVLALIPTVAWSRAGNQMVEVPTVWAAVRCEQPVGEAPVAATVITCDDIVKYGHRRLAQVFANVPGFNMSDAAMPASLTRL